MQQDTLINLMFVVCSLILGFLIGVLYLGLTNFYNSTDELKANEKLAKSLKKKSKKKNNIT